MAHGVESLTMTYVLPLTLRVYLHSFLSGGLRKTIFYAEVRFGRSRSSKVIDFGTNRKRVCDFQSVIVTLVLSCTVLEILQVFALMTPPLFHPNFGVLPLDRIADVGVSPSMYLKLFGGKIIFDVFQPMWKTYVTNRQTDRRTDGQTTYCGIAALCIASRGKNYWKYIVDLLTRLQNLLPYCRQIFRKIFNQILTKSRF